MPLRWKGLHGDEKLHNLYCLINIIMSHDSSVDIATRYRLDGPGIESRRWQDFLHPSRPAMGPNHSPIKWVPGLSCG